MKELKKFLLENYVDENGDLFIKDLDFSDFNGNVVISVWWLKNSKRNN